MICDEPAQQSDCIASRLQGTTGWQSKLIGPACLSVIYDVLFGFKTLGKWGLK